MTIHKRISEKILPVFKKKKITFIISSIILFLTWYSTSCTFINEEDLLKDLPCDTTNISYNDLTYIFSGICSTCHSAVFTYKPGIIMDTYSNVKSSINTGLVLPAIKHVDGVIPMPGGMEKLNSCEIEKIEAWINAGMPENK